MRVLFVEDEKISRITLSDLLRKDGHEVTACETGPDAIEALAENNFEIVITDLRLPKMNGLDIVKAAKDKNKDCHVIVITAYATVETAISALKLGAYDYLTKPFAPDKLLGMVKNIRQYRDVIRENAQLKTQINRYKNNLLIGNSPVMQKLVQTLKFVAASDHTILIEGESGTGKEVIARTLHQYSERCKGPFIPVNCAALPESLLESELFGHEKGAFTGALRRHTGLIQRAHNGTLFIDDIDDFPIQLQVKLLRVLQEREIVPVGSMQTIAVDFRVICATKVNLLQMVREGNFREDLYYRLNTIPLHVPPLRERKEDLPVLIEHFIDKHLQGNAAPELKPFQLERMMQHDWPGNVRELESTIQRMLALPQDADFLQFVWDSQKTPAETNSDPHNMFDPKMISSFEESVRTRELEIIDWAMDRAAMNISKAAQLLKMPRSTLHSKMEKLNYFKAGQNNRTRFLRSGDEKN